VIYCESETCDPPSEHGRSFSELADENGIILRCTYKYLARSRASGPAALADRGSVSCCQQPTLDLQKLQQAMDLRHQLSSEIRFWCRILSLSPENVLHLLHMARLLQSPFSTFAFARAFSLLGLGRLKKLEPRPPVQRQERERPGHLIQLDMKSLIRFRKMGYRSIGNHH
jgi:hypothetical protein